MKLIAVRHGQTELNKRKQAMGRTDEPLNHEGVAQVQNLLLQLKDIKFDLIFSSPLKRAKQTAEMIAKEFGMKIEFRDELLERDYGSLSENTWEKMAEISGILDIKTIDTKQQYDYRLFGGESVDQVKQRLLEFIEEMKGKYTNKIILVIAHGGILRLLYSLFKNQEIGVIENASIHEFEP